MYVSSIQRSEVDVRYTGAGETSSYDPPCRCQEPNPSPQQEEQMLLTAEPTL